jgi:hypothetical protein
VRSDATVCFPSDGSGKELARLSFSSHSLIMLADEQTSPEQIEIYRRMAPGRRLEVAEQLYWSARRMKAAWIKNLHADWTEAQIEAEVTRNFSHAGN